MPSLKQIQKRISSVKNTQKITYAMYMVSAAKLRRAQDAAENSRPYADSLSALIGDIVANVDGVDHPLLVPREEIKKVELVVFTSDRGLCGGFNSNINRAAMAFVQDNSEKYECIDISTVGKKAADYFKRRKVPVRKTTTNLVREVSYNMATTVADDLTERYLKKEVDAVYLVYAQFVSALTQRPTITQILPFSVGGEGEEDQVKNQLDYIYEPGAKEILGMLLPRQVRTQVYTAMLESVASEHGARMTAMDSASSNASDMIDKLTLKFNRARQAAITGELMEIISGAEALKE